MAKKRLKKKQRKQDLQQKGIDNPQLLKDLLQNEKKYKKFDQVYNTYKDSGATTEKIARDPYAAESYLEEKK